MNWLLALYAVVLFSWLFPPFWIFQISGNISEAIARETSNNPEGIIDLAQIVPFEWSELFLYGPYQRRETICAELGLDGFECWWTVPIEPVEGGPYLLIFRSGSKVVHREYHDLANGIIATPPHPIPRSYARYRVSHSRWRGGVLLIHQAEWIDTEAIH